MKTLRFALSYCTLTFLMMPLGLLVAILSHGLACMGELWLLLDHEGRIGYLPLVLGNVLLFALFLDKALRKHLLQGALKRSSGRRLLFSLCPLGVGVALTAYLLKAFGLALLSAEEPRYLLVMLAESSMVVLLASRVVLVHRRRLLKTHKPGQPKPHHLRTGSQKNKRTNRL